jgi:hypothetical protein
MTELSRRQALVLMGAAGGLLASGGSVSPAAGAAPPSLDLDDEAQLFAAFRKLAYSQDDAVTWWWMRGTRFGVVDSVATPFWDMYVGSWFTTRDLDDGAYEVTMAGANFYTPPHETTLLRSFTNPYTGAQVPVNYAPPQARKTVITPQRASAFGEVNIPGMESTQNSDIGPGWIEGEDVIIRGDLALTATPTDPDSDRDDFTVNDWSTYVGDLAEVADPAVRNAPCRQYFNDILSWPGWLQMGDQPGSYVSRCYGRKVFTLEEMPRTWRDLFAEAQPGAAADPAAVLRG